MKKKIHEIIIVDDMPPEASAMLQALYSRSPRTVKEHIEKVKEVGPEKFMSSYYVGYGHKSIGDCGSTSIFVEHVSMLVAKAIQQWPLYSGQEASTRYLDMGAQPVINPLENKEGKEIQDEWISFYKRVISEIVPILEKRYPKKDDQDEKIWIKAIKAKAFDIARGFLPSGSTTYLSWQTNLRQAHDHIKELRHHPLEEVKNVAKTILESLKNKYPSSFNHVDNAEEEKYLEKINGITYFDDPKINKFTAKSTLNKEELKKYKKILSSRPPKTEIPNQLRQMGNIVFEFLLDFGSFRDLQRHRSSVQTMPLLGTRHGFHEWYLDQLGDELKQDAIKLLKKQEARIKKLKTTKEISQYYTAMGYKVSCKMVCSLPSAVYIAELRSMNTVHPTLRVVAQKMGVAIKKIDPNINIYCDNSSDSWDIKRGKQDIIKK